MLIETKPVGGIPIATPSPREMPAARGNGRFFGSENFHFQTLRALMETPSGSADINEVLEAIKTITDGDFESWFIGWEALADRVFGLAEGTKDPISKSNAYMRAYNYQRVAEFMLPPNDPKRVRSWQKSLALFDKGIDASGVRREVLRVPYQGADLRAHYFPGAATAEDKPLVMLVGGYDSVLEELYPLLGKPALMRGYSVLAYEGPGQGQPLRDGLTFTAEWEKPNAAVLDAFLATHAKPKQIVLIGMSMGGYFAPRAAAFDKRIDGVVAWDTCYDFGECARWLAGKVHDFGNSKSTDLTWFWNNACWTLGTGTIDESATKFAAYTLAPVASKITQSVLIMAGELDYGIPLHQTVEFEKSLVNARSVTIKVFDRMSGGGEHCQSGNLTLVHATLFDWLLEKFS